MRLLIYNPDTGYRVEKDVSEIHFSKGELKAYDYNWDEDKQKMSKYEIKGNTVFNLIDM